MVLVICGVIRSFTAFPMRLPLPVLVLACALAVPGVRAQTLVYPTFSSTAGLQLNSVSVSGGEIVLADTGRDRGSVFTASQYQVASGFSAVFEFRISNPSGAADDTGVLGADGLAFVIHRDPSGASVLGSFGENLGYGGASAATRIDSSVAVEFDTFRNSYDPNSNHMGINAGGSMTSLATANLATRIDSGAKWTVWVDYNGSVLEVRANTTGIRPVSADLSHSINLLSTLGGTTAFLGFTGATGSGYGDHSVLGFAFSDTYLAGGLAAVPEPSTWALLILGLGAVAVAGWRRRRS